MLPVEAENSLIIDYCEIGNYENISTDLLNFRIKVILSNESDSARTSRGKYEKNHFFGHFDFHDKHKICSFCLP